MPTTPGQTIRGIADIVKTLTNCSGAQADAAEAEICKSPKAIATLAAACGISASSFAVGGKLVVAGLATQGATLGPGLILTAAGAMGAKRFCTSFVNGALK